MAAKHIFPMSSHLNLADADRLSPRERVQLQRRCELHRKYAEAVSLYADTELPLKEIARQTEVSLGGLGSYLRRHWRELVLRRNGLSADEGTEVKAVRIMAAGRQNPVAHAKYKDAVEACDLMDYIDLNVSQVARKFNLDGTALANFMRIHYPDTLVRREEIRRRLGLNDNVHHGVRKESTEQYGEAVELYRTTEMTLPEVARLCKVSEGGLLQHLRFYHKDVLKEKREIRRKAKEKERKVRGELTGNGRKHEPASVTVQKYAEALALVQNTALSMSEIVQKTGVPAEGFRFYLHKWHKELVLERLGIDTPVDETADLRKARRKMKTVAAKYAEAIDSMKRHPRPMALVAAEYGFHPETFRDYLHKHEPELAGQLGMKRSVTGKLVSVRSEQKYGAAVRLYETTTEPLKSIAKRLGLTYNSVGGYVRRNCPEAIRHHEELLAAEKEKSKQTDI